MPRRRVLEGDELLSGALGLGFESAAGDAEVVVAGGDGHGRILVGATQQSQSVL
jgi:hypothetical protein